MERKSMPMVAWYVLSKESYMNRVMSEVFPTVMEYCISMFFFSSKLRPQGNLRAH